MPFTPSHAVVALPFVRARWIGAPSGIPAAIAVGAMTPDLPLFVKGTPISYGATHDLAWLPLTGLLAFVLLLIWRCVLRPAVRELSPGWLATRLPGEWDAGAGSSLRETVAPASWRALPARRLFPLVLAAALLFGVVTHIVWDLFTHEGRAGIAVLDAPMGPLVGYQWLQYGSGLFGVVVIAIWWALRLRRADVAPSVPRLLPAGVRWTWWLALPVLLAVGLLIGYAALGPFREGFGPEHLAYPVLPPACGVWAGLTLVLAVVVQFVRRTRSAG